MRTRIFFMTPPMPSTSCRSYPGLSAGLGVRRSSADGDDAVPPLPLLGEGEGEGEEELLGLRLAVLLLGPPVPVPVPVQIWPPGAKDEVDALLSGVAAVACW
jgi:hypothetical protein